MAHEERRPGGAAGTQERGRAAERPRDIPGRGWRDVAVRVKGQLGEDDVGLLAAGVAFYWLLALFPAIAALVSIYGLVADPAQVERQMASLSGILPGGARELLSEQLHRIVSSSSSALGLGLVVSIALALWSASKGTMALMTATNVAYDEEERRGTVRLYGTGLLLTLGALVVVVLALLVTAVAPAVLDGIGLGDAARWAIELGRWPALALLVIVGLSVLYRYGPSRERPRWSWVSWGSLIATVVWVVASIGFSIFASRFGSYNETYGSLAAVVVLLFWMWIGAYAILLGAEVNCELERQTERDTTTGRPRPMGSRGAYAADTVGPAPA